MWDRFWPKVDATGDCWEWTASVHKSGYGRIGTLESKGKTAYAHRVARELLIGPIPAGMTIDHMCFNKICVNPDHLRVLSARENALNVRWDCPVKMNRVKTHCSKGHEFKPENTRLYTPPGKAFTRRVCKTCSNRPRPERNKYKK